MRRICVESVSGVYALKVRVLPLDGLLSWCDVLLIGHLQNLLQLKLITFLKLFLIIIVGKKLAIVPATQSTFVHNDRIIDDMLQSAWRRIILMLGLFGGYTSSVMA